MPSFPGRWRSNAAAEGAAADESAAMSTSDVELGELGPSTSGSHPGARQASGEAAPPQADQGQQGPSLVVIEVVPLLLLPLSVQPLDAAQGTTPPLPQPSMLTSPCTLPYYRFRTQPETSTSGWTSLDGRRRPRSGAATPRRLQTARTKAAQTWTTSCPLQRSTTRRWWLGGAAGASSCYVRASSNKPLPEAAPTSGAPRPAAA